MLDPFTIPFVQQGLWEILLLSVGAGVLGTWIVLRGLSFYAHGVAAATFPGLVLASGVGFAGPLGALAVALLFAGTAGRLAARSGQRDHSTQTAMLLVGALAVGVLLASNVFPSAINVTSLLFGSLLLIADRDLWTAAAVSVTVVAATAVLGPRWLAVGFDRPAAQALGVRADRADAVLLLLVALMAVATLSAVGSLLAAALMVIPAATVRPWIDRMRTWQVATVVLTAAEGTAGLWLSARTNAPPGATIAVLAGVMFTLSVLTHSAARRSRSRRLRPALVVTVVLAGLGVAGCGSSDDADNASSGGTIPVVATTSQVADIVRNVGGDAVSVHQILANGTDPHDYEPRPKDITESASAKVVFTSGLGLDSWISDVLKQAGNDAPVVALGEDVPVLLPAEGDDHAGHDHDEASEDHAGHDHDGESEDHAGHDHGDGEHDPHWWHNPKNVEHATVQVRDALIEADPAARTTIEANANAYLAKLQTLDAGIKRCMGTVPAADRRIVTSHDAFNYFADAYGITIVGAVIPSQTTQAQASAADVARLSALIRKQQVKAIFPESSVNPKVAEALGRETGATTDLTLYGDSLGAPGSDGATYLDMEQHNADAVLRGLTGNAERCSIAGL